MRLANPENCTRAASCLGSERLDLQLRRLIGACNRCVSRLMPAERGPGQGLAKKFWGLARWQGLAGRPTILAAAVLLILGIGLLWREARSVRAAYQVPVLADAATGALSSHGDMRGNGDASREPKERAGGEPGTMPPALPAGAPGGTAAPPVAAGAVTELTSPPSRPRPLDGAQAAGKRAAKVGEGAVAAEATGGAPTREDQVLVESSAVGRGGGETPAMGPQPAPMAAALAGSDAGGDGRGEAASGGAVAAKGADEVTSGASVEGVNSTAEGLAEAAPAGGGNSSLRLTPPAEASNAGGPGVGPSCDLSAGRWVPDKTRPLYQGARCPWLAPNWACRKSERPDFAYEQYRWQPRGCDLPPFDRRDFLRRMRNRTVAFIGDSLGQQQFQSLLCLLAAQGLRGDDPAAHVKDVGLAAYGFHVPPGERRPGGWAYRVAPSNTTVLFYWTSFLCEAVRKGGGPLHLDRPDAFLRRHLAALDVVVLNTGHHWGGTKLKGFVFHMNGTRVPDAGGGRRRRRGMSTRAAQELAVRSVVRWADGELRGLARPPLILLRTRSPRHFMNGEWDTGGRCDNVQVNVSEITDRDQSQRDLTAEAAVNGTAVKLLNITHLSEFRGEAHPSIWDYRLKKGAQDCLHWCLPGIPDVWNELLHAHVIMHDAETEGTGRA